MILDPLIGGIAMGCIYSLIALGYNMLIRAMNLLHFAQGEVMMVGALSGVTLVSALHVPYLVAIPLIMVLCAALSLALDAFAYRPIRRRNVPVINLIIATLGVSIVLSNGAILVWGAEPIRYPTIYGSGALMLGPVRLPPQFLAPLLVGGGLMVALQLFFTRSLVGIAMRAAAQDRETARLMGIDIDRTIQYTFAISGAMGGAAVALAVLLLALPWLLPQRYFLRVVDLGLVYAVLALGLQLLVGSAGQLSLGHAAFYGTGAYTSAILVRKLGLPVELSFVAGGVVAALLGLTLVPILRLRGNELAVATLGFGVIVHAVILNEEWLTEGPFGMMKIPPFQLGPLVFNTEFRFYFLGLAVVAGTYLAFRRPTRSRFGRALQARRQSAGAAVTSGINPVPSKSKVFVIAPFTAGLGGGLFAHLNRYLNPNDFTLTESINVLIMIVVGGLRSLEGAIVGAMIIVFASEYLRAFKEYRLILFGALLVLLMALGADGLRGLPSALARRFRRG